MKGCALNLTETIRVGIVARKCFNCIRENKRLNLGLDENNNTNHRDCPTHPNKLSFLKKKGE